MYPAKKILDLNSVILDLNVKNKHIHLARLVVSIFYYMCKQTRQRSSLYAHLLSDQRLSALSKTCIWILRDQLVKKGDSEQISWLSIINYGENAQSCIKV